MAELLGLQDYLPYVKLAAWGIGIALTVIAAAASTYLVKTSCGPLFVVLQWIVGRNLGEEPGEIFRGVSYGARMVLWAVVIGFVGWFFFH